MRENAVAEKKTVQGKEMQREKEEKKGATVFVKQEDAEEELEKQAQRGQRTDEGEQSERFLRCGSVLYSWK